MSITFPVLRRVKVSGYGIFDNERSSGIEHELVHGVHVIAGINGLGKTTLLNILYRSLLGPKDMSKDDSGLASTQHKLANWRNRKYFSSRVRDGAKGAWAEVEIGFGKRRVTVRRSLRTLEVQALAVDGVPEEVASQDRYEDIAQELSGCASYFDFFAILRFIVFFLEDRAELIWDRRSQFDMFRLLFYDRKAALEAAEAYDEAQRLDSQYRNERVPIRRAERELQAYDEAEQSGLVSEIRATRRSLLAAQSASVEGIEAIEAAKSLTEGIMLQREKARLDLEEARRAHEYEQQ
ncbi:MAG TPA: AAA family ATPase, partial [Terriglobales bacterium]|nr:AAA family ATPase [Terriglobales bacterium]